MDSNFVAEKPLGYFQAVAGSINTAQTLVSLIGSSIPPGTAIILMQPEAQAIRWRDDGTAPTATVGYPLAVGSEFRYTGQQAANICVIAQVAGAILNIVCFGG